MLDLPPTLTPSNIIHLTILGPSTVLPPRLLELCASIRNMFLNGYPFLLRRLQRYHDRCWEEYICRPTYRERKYLIAEKEPRCAKTGAPCFNRTRMINAQQGVVEVCLIFLWSWLIIRLFARLKVARLRLIWRCPVVRIPQNNPRNPFLYPPCRTIQSPRPLSRPPPKPPILVLKTSSEIQIPSTFQLVLHS